MIIIVMGSILVMIVGLEGDDLMMFDVLFIEVEIFDILRYVVVKC